MATLCCDQTPNHVSLVQVEGKGHLTMATLSCDQTPNCMSFVQEEGGGHLTMAALCCDQTPNCMSLVQEESEGHLMMAMGPKISLYDTMRQSGAAPLVENLHSQLKLKEGEISQLQVGTSLCCYSPGGQGIALHSAVCRPVQSMQLA